MHLTRLTAVPAGSQEEGTDAVSLERGTVMVMSVRRLLIGTAVKRVRCISHLLMAFDYYAGTMGIRVLQLSSARDVTGPSLRQPGCALQQYAQCKRIVPIKASIPPT